MKDKTYTFKTAEAARQFAATVLVPRGMKVVRKGLVVKLVRR